MKSTRTTRQLFSLLVDYQTDNKEKNEMKLSNLVTRQITRFQHIHNGPEQSLNGSKVSTIRQPACSWQSEQKYKLGNLSKNTTEWSAREKYRFSTQTQHPHFTPPPLLNLEFTHFHWVGGSAALVELCVSVKQKIQVRYLPLFIQMCCWCLWKIQFCSIYCLQKNLVRESVCCIGGNWIFLEIVSSSPFISWNLFNVLK